MHTFAFIFYILFLISNIFADCPSGTLSGPNKAYCYSVFNKPTDWNSAQANCISIGGYLARVDSAFTNEFFSKTAQANFTVPGRFWLGGAVINGSIGWSDGYNANYSNWAKGQPVIANGVDAIVMHLPNGLWYNENRLGKNPYICEVPIASSPCCTAGWTYFEQVNRCYMTLDVRINFWTDSKNSCLVAGGNLVSIHSDDDEFIVTGKFILSVKQKISW
uniref:C-type lectin domain-containing protein n=1 Tax=Acrobeloides nanus TaxID=290746 RepID=A0A914CMZ8_9BILA